MGLISETDVDDIAASAADAIAGAEDPGDFDLRRTFAAFAHYLRPDRVFRQSMGLGADLIKIMAGSSEISVDGRDSRFRDPAWTENPVYRRLGASYVAFCNAVDELIEPGDEDWRTREMARFAAELVTSALAPTNTLLGNPAALKRAIDTGGLSLVRGARNWAHDVRHNRGMPQQVDSAAFGVGRNLAVTPGAVVFRNDLLEILQYTPTTTTVYSTPVLIVTPQINKYYFLDLAPGRSFVEYLVSQGYQPFMVSWKNPTSDNGHWGVNEYCEALLEAMDAIQEITGSETINTFGFCAGGITFAGLLSHLAAQGDDRVGAISFAVTLLDFSQPAMIGMLQADPLLRTAKSRSMRKGIIEGRDLAALFTWFRPNDLVWNYWVNNYLMGNNPPAFDILAWNEDSTNLPGCLHGDFLDIFGDDSLAEPGGFTVLGTPVDLGSIRNDAFVTGAINDHLTPWVGCYRTTQLLGGTSEFVLSNVGHIASLVNPPGNPKANYFVGPEPGADPEAWRANATQRQGSWWERWVEWAGDRSGPKRRARRTLGSKQHPPLADAPGTYVLRGN